MFIDDDETMTNMRHILVVTGSRAEYDILYPVLHAIHHDPELRLSLLVTGPHLSEKYGLSVQQIEKDGFRIADRVYNLIESNRKIGRLISLGNQISHFAQTFDRERPDIILVCGDREEAITTALAGAYMDIPVAHLAGGDIAHDGNIDNAVRYAASKFAHLHFTIHPAHSQTLLRLGEDPWRIHYTGNPALDRFLETPALSLAELAQRLGFPPIASQPFLLVTYHPIITEFEHEAEHAHQLMRALEQTQMPCVINSPNSDAGNQVILDVYARYRSNPAFFFFKNLDRLEYVNLLRHARCMVGNSSAGLLEAPSLGLPVVNVGQRQRGRLHGSNVQFVDCLSDAIGAAIQKACFDTAYREAVKTAPNPYGDGKAAARIVEVLKSAQLNTTLLHKNITYQWPQS